MQVEFGEFITLEQAALLLPKRRKSGKPINRATVYRWAIDGFKGVRLPFVRVGRLMFTSKAAVEQFVSEISKGGRQ